jgi:hypothetical protein
MNVMTVSAQGISLGLTARGKMINGGLVGSTPSLKRQNEGVDGNDDNGNQKAHSRGCKRSADNTAPADPC